MKYIVLGNNGFIGNHIYNVLKNNNLEVIGLSRNDFDITNESDYIKFDFSNSTIIDCIASIDNAEKNFEVNVTGLSSFIDYLKKSNFNFNYIYLSTTSTQIEEQVSTNSYIKSKLLGEEYIKKNVLNYKIIRLIFPFGKGENPDRLISRLTQRIKNNEMLYIDNVTLNLTPIDYLTNNILNLLSNKSTEINFTDGKVYKLKDIVDCLYEILHQKPNYIYNEDHKINLAINHYIEVNKINSKILKYGVLQ